MKNNIKVSIVVPCYNSEKWIRQSILSALNQTYKNKEVIFVDNESTDNSLKIAKNIHSKFSDLKVLTAPNLYKYSWTEPVEEALKNSSGEYFTILGSDDYIKEDYIEKVVNIILKDTDKIKLLQSPILGVNSGNAEGYLGEIKHSYKSLSEFKNLLFTKSPVNTPTMIYSKKLHDNGIIRWNSKDYLGAADYDLYFNIADKGLFIYPCPRWMGYCYRWHPGQSTWGMHKEKVDYDLVVKDVWKKKWNID